MGLGSNLGDRRARLVEGAARLSDLGAVVAVSSLWETAPIGGVDQPDYLNAVAVIDTVVGPVPLLESCLEAERSAGRTRDEKWGPRTLDLDVLLYGDAAISVPGLTIPHPRLAERRFVLEPLAEAWPNANVPGLGPVEGLLEAVERQPAVRLDDDWWPPRG